SCFWVLIWSMKPRLLNHDYFVIPFLSPLAILYFFVVFKIRCYVFEVCQRLVLRNCLPVPSVPFLLDKEINGMAVHVRCSIFKTQRLGVIIIHDEVHLTCIPILQRRYLQSIQQVNTVDVLLAELLADELQLMPVDRPFLSSVFFG